MDSKLTQYLNSEMSEIVDWENIEALLSLPEVDPNKTKSKYKIKEDPHITI